jgi:hypothetical protein
MTNWLAGMEITADRLNDNTATDEVTSGVVDASGFATSSFVGRKVSGVTTIELFTNRTGATITEGATNTGNVADTAVATLPSGYRPQEAVNCIVGNGSVDGEATIASDGSVVLRSISGNTGWANGSNLRFTACWISENG